MARRGRITRQELGIIAEMARRGMGSVEIAERMDRSEAGIRSALERLAAQDDAAAEAAAALPERRGERYTDEEVAQRVAYARDLLVRALEAGAERVAEALTAGDPARDAAQATAMAANRIRDLEEYLDARRMTGADLPDTREERERAYIALLWRRASGGDMRAARMLAVAWGIEQVAGRGAISIEWADPEPEDQSPPEETPEGG